MLRHRILFATIAAFITAASGARAATAASHADLQWLDRVTYGVNSTSLAEFERLGRSGYLDAQLAARDEHLPPAVQAQIDAMPISHQSIGDDIAALATARDQLKSIDDSQAKVEARKALRKQGVALAVQTQEREMLRAIYSPAQLKEQMVWFWLNHFNVFDRKGPEAWLDADYVESAIRPNALGNFRDLVMATLTHPAMLVYLDNARNEAKHHNENYARELMELHTLGVNAGYTQNDVQEMVRVLTGVGVALNPREPRLRPNLQARYVRHDGFEFNPARHDFGDKVLLGHTIRGSGFDEVRQAVDLLVAQPACAHFISGELATYFVSDNPPAALVDAMADTFQRSARRYPLGAAHVVRFTTVRRFARHEVQGSDALRGFVRAPGLRRPRCTGSAPPDRVVEQPGRRRIRASDAGRIPAGFQRVEFVRADERALRTGARDWRRRRAVVRWRGHAHGAAAIRAAVRAGDQTVAVDNLRWRHWARRNRRRNGTPTCSPHPNPITAEGHGHESSPFPHYPRRTARRRIGRAPVRRAGFLAALPARFPARRLRLREPAGALRERLLLRVASHHRHRAA
jgi:uncharacterized protein (DUF1800 family)